MSFESRKKQQESNSLQKKLEDVSRELKRQRAIQECGGIEEYRKMQVCIAMNSTCLGANVGFG
jgi:hypothetical protein